MNPMRLDHRELTEHDGFVRALARRLVDDEGDADDLAQNVWLAVARRPVHHVVSVKAWLATIVRRLASNTATSRARRERHERRAPSPSRCDGTGEILEREHARRALVDTVLALGSDSRAVVLLRYFEGLPPRHIAARLGVPVETVRTRLRRAIEQLRERLGEGHAGDWKFALLPLCGSGFAAKAGAGTTVAVASGVAIMTKSQVAIGVAALCLLAGVAYLARHENADVPRGPSAPVDVRETVSTAPRFPQARGGILGAESRPRDEAGIVVVPFHDPRTTGRLTVHVHRKDTRAPLAGVVVSVGAGIDGSLLRRSVSGVDGSATFDNLAPDGYRLTTDRSKDTSTATVVADRTVDIGISITPRFVIDGLVVANDGTPVSGAAVWLTSNAQANDGRSLSGVQSDAAGRFAIEVDGDDVLVGAELSGWHLVKAVNAHWAFGNARRAVRLVLAAGAGSLSVVVTDPDGRPIPYARIRVVSGSGDLPEASGARTRTRYARHAEADGDGIALIESLPADRWDVHVSSLGLDAFECGVQIEEGERQTVHARLPRGIRLEGTARRSTGEPVSGLLRVGETEFTSAATMVVAADGAFAISGLSRNVRWAAFWSPGFGTLTAELPEPTGAVIRWNPVFEPDRVLRLRVVDESNAPVANCWTEVLRPRSEVSVTGRRSAPVGGFTDRNGQTALLLPSTAAVTVVVRGPSAQNVEIGRVADVTPGGDEVVARIPPSRLPSAFIVGRVIGIDGTAAGAATVQARATLDEANFGSEVAVDQTGAFRLGPLMPSKYTVQISAPEGQVEPIGERMLLAGETWDLAAVRLSPGGAIEARFCSEDGASLKNLTAVVRRPGKQGWSDLTFRREPDGLCADRLAPGRYIVAVSGADVAPQRFPVDVLPGETTRATLVVRAGVRVTLRSEHSAADQGAQAGFSVEDEDGGRLVTAWTGAGTPRDSNQSELTMRLVPGRYRFIATVGPRRGDTLATISESHAGQEVRITIGPEEKRPFRVRSLTETSTRPAGRERE